MRKLVFVGITLVLSLASFAQGELSVVDQAGREVSIALPVERVVSLYGVATLYLYALGVQDRLVLGTYVGLKPGSPSWEALLSIDPDLPEKYTRRKPSLEEILARRPDIVLASRQIDIEATQELMRFGIPVVLLFAEDVEGVKGAARLLGRIFGEEKRAEELISYFEGAVERIASAIEERGLRRPRVLFVGTRPFRVASGEMYQSHLIELAGGTPVTAGLKGYWQDVDIEQILAWDPEVIFIAPYGRVQPGDLLGDPLWGAVSAVRGGRVHKMPRVFSPWDIPTPESFLGLLWMASKIHPELDIDIASEAVSFYRDFYGYELPEDLVSVIGG